jgi:hypothetical protein
VPLDEQGLAARSASPRRQLGDPTYEQGADKAGGQPSEETITAPL